ncbi:MAG TPA: HAD family hydrolase [Actinomycetota bacterium]|nr:HAD family hydrolase [Actinomycetota bacterium]
MSHRLILWDVDGTLVWTGPATRQAFDRAVASVLRQAVGDHEVSFGGKTDPQIALEIMSELSVSDDEARRRLPGVLQALEREMELAIDLLRQDGRVLPGVLELLERFDRRPEVVQSLLTGNTEANARLKIRAFGLDQYLDLEVAAFGSDSADRNELVSVALEKLERLRGMHVPPQDVWIIGDTARDLACARAAGARCLLVATGLVPFDVLSAAGAEAALPDLGDVDAVERLLLSRESVQR